MNADRARRAHAILTAALDAHRTKRDTVVSSLCAGDAALEARVRKLLAATDQSTGFLDSPALAGHSQFTAPVPDAVANYLVVGVLGTGGMATVYEALQENPKRHVALKVMHQSMTSTDAFLRFRLEVETLARLHHPGIAQIFEAGTAQLGRPSPSPFFAMELVPQALTITDYARTHNLPLRERVAMFASVCDAVLHGHQYGVIHRDIKPGNVLVAPDGSTKVIDFGIARMVSPSPGVAASITAQTKTSSIIGTLNSMSPEQCTAPDTIDIRSDVYSLGTVLYELVTGRLPHDLSQCSIPEAVRIIAEQPAPDPGSLCPEARGDLAAVIAKAMEKDRTRRYGSAGALAADVRRWLSFQPVEARPASTPEHVWKFVRRNPPLAAALAVAVLALILGTSVSARFALVAGQARDAAIERERQLEAVAEFQESLLQGINVLEMADSLRASVSADVAEAARSRAGPGQQDAAATDAQRDFSRLIADVNFTSVLVRAIDTGVLSPYAHEIDTTFVDQPLLRARLLQQLASTKNTLGLYAQAEPLLRRALELRTSALGPDHEDTLQSTHSMGSLFITLGRYDDAVAILTDTRARCTRVLGPENPFTLRVGTSLGGALRQQGDIAAAHQIWGETLLTQRRVRGDDHSDTLRTLNNYGIALAMLGKPAEAEACWRELLERRRRLLGEDHPAYRSTLGNLGVLLQDQGKLDEAKTLLEQSLASDRRAHGDTHGTTLMSMTQLASLLVDTGDLPRAEALQRECHAGRSATLGPEHPETLRALAELARILHARGDSESALALASQAHNSLRQLLGDSHPDTLHAAGIVRDIESSAVSTPPPRPPAP